MTQPQARTSVCYAHSLWGRFSPDATQARSGRGRGRCRGDACPAPGEACYHPLREARYLPLSHLPLSCGHPRASADTERERSVEMHALPSDEELDDHLAAAVQAVGGRGCGMARWCVLAMPQG